MCNKYEGIIADLISKGFSIIDNFFAADLLENLKLELAELREQEVLRKAKIGREETKQLATSIRADLTYWLTGKTAAEKEYLTIMEEFRIKLNEALFLGLFYYEAQFAFYPLGAFYKKHFDSFKGEKNRMISMVTYLNHNWQIEQGGLLKLYDEQEQELQSVLPEFGRMIVFLSEDMLHEVTITNRERESIAGWFRCREIGLE